MQSRVCNITYSIPTYDTVWNYTRVVDGAKEAVNPATMTLGDGKRPHLSPQMIPCRYPAFRLSTNLEPVSTKLQSRVELPSSSCQCMLSNMNMADSMEPPATTSPAPAAMAIKRIRQACTTCRYGLHLIPPSSPFSSSSP